MGTILGILSIPSFVAAHGLSRGRPWGRTAGLINSFLNLLSIPFGTGVSIYTLWVVFSDRGTELPFAHSDSRHDLGLNLYQGVRNA